MFWRKKKNNKKILYLIFIIVLLAIAIWYIKFEEIYKDKIYPKTFIGEINLGGQTIEEARDIINEEVNKINHKGIIFIYNEKKVTITPVIKSFNTEFAYEIMSFDVPDTIERAYNKGRDSNGIANLFSKIPFLSRNKHIPLKTDINREEIMKILKEQYSEFEVPATNVAFKIIITEDGDRTIIDFELVEEKLGKVLNYEKALNNLHENILDFNSNDIFLQSKTDYPAVYSKESLNIEVQARSVIAVAPLKLENKEKNWEITKVEIANWLIIQKIDGEIGVGLDEEKVLEYLKTTVAPNINTEPIRARFDILDGKVSNFEIGEDGVELDIDVNKNKIINEFLGEKKNIIELVVNEIKDSVQDIDTLGIKEILGTGHSSFAGSPKNRIHNITIGANSLNGLLIRPGEELSLIDALGDIDGESGYLQELVIKGNKTIPEFGGGLCQVGTTLFRATLSTGLPITQRRNHSYRVSYYEPAGTDATIYDPWPDYRFVNDTPNYILIQTRIEGTDLYFDFWGKNDGRVATTSDPVIYNITKPEPTKIIETLDLEVGERKCTEKAHNGADAYFDYTVVYPKLSPDEEAEIKERRFTSHYIPWQEVCFVGVEKLTTTDEGTEDEMEKDNSEEIAVE